MMAIKDPLILLATIESRARRSAAELPRREAVKKTWSGIGFGIGTHDLVVPLEEVREVLPYPHTSRVPGTKEWVKGIANVRGNLLPVMDIKGFLGLGLSSVGAASRVLVIDHAGVYSGMLVDRVMGMQHFALDERSEDSGLTESALAVFSQGRFVREGRDWPVMSLTAVAADPEYLLVAK
jgi:twitching motility protein PilI